MNNILWHFIGKPVFGKDRDEILNEKKEGDRIQHVMKEHKLTFNFILNGKEKFKDRYEEQNLCYYH